MGYDTYVTGGSDIAPALNAAEIGYLRAYLAQDRRQAGGVYRLEDSDPDGTHRPLIGALPDGVPSPWCPWQVSLEGDRLEFDEDPSGHHFVEWLDFIVEHFLQGDGLDHDLAAREGLHAVFANFSFDHTLRGLAYMQGEDPEDQWGYLLRQRQGGGP